MKEYPEFSWGIFSLQGKEDNEVFGNDRTHLYNIMTQGFVRDTPEFEKFMKIHHKIFDDCGKYFYENYFKDLITAKKILEDEDQEKVQLIFDNTLILLYHYCMNNFDNKTDFDFDKINIRFLSELRDEVSNRKIKYINTLECDGWKKVENFLTALSDKCIKHAFITLNYGQINSIMERFTTEMYMKYFLEPVECPVTIYSKDKMERRFEEKIPVIWAMALNQSKRIDNISGELPEYQSAFYFDPAENKFKFPAIVDFFVNLRSHCQGELRDLNYSQRDDFRTKITPAMMSRVFLEISNSENEKQEITKYMMTLDYDIDFYNTNGMYLHEYHQQNYDKHGWLTAKMKAETLHAKADEIHKFEMSFPQMS